MFDKLFSRFKQAAPEKESGDDALALSVAALLVEAARTDEQYEAGEIAIVDRALKSKFGLNDADAAALRAKAEIAQESATDIQRFTKVAKSMSSEEKIGLIESLWEIVLSDGTRDSFEDTLMRRICGLIYVDDQDSGAARARVAARLNLS
jgi:uncharacterized tellurite resistance protein B-like protein